MLSLNYKREKKGRIEERKAGGSVRGDMMKLHVHFDPKFKLAQMVDRDTARMVRAHMLEKGWVLAHIDIHRFSTSFTSTPNSHISENTQNADGSFKHFKSTGILEMNLKGNPFGT